MTKEEVKPSNINQLTDEQLYGLYKDPNGGESSLMALFEMARRVGMMRVLIDALCPKAEFHVAELSVASMFKTFKLQNTASKGGKTWNLAQPF